MVTGETNRSVRNAEREVGFTPASLSVVAIDNGCIVGADADL
jgi:hypothetical protein